jgi:hypothetical protein
LTSILLDTLNDFLRVFIRFESFLFRLWYLSLLALLFFFADIQQAGSIELFWEIKRAESEAPFFGLITLPFWLDVLAWSITVLLFLGYVAYVCDMDGVIMRYTPLRYVVVLVMLFLPFWTIVFLLKEPILTTTKFLLIFLASNGFTFVTFNASY